MPEVFLRRKGAKMKMNKREWLFLANKGKVQYDDLEYGEMEFEVTLRPR